MHHSSTRREFLKNVAVASAAELSLAASPGRETPPRAPTSSRSKTRGPARATGCSTTPASIRQPNTAARGSKATARTPACAPAKRSSLRQHESRVEFTLDILSARLLRRRRAGGWSSRFGRSKGTHAARSADRRRSGCAIASWARSSSLTIPTDWLSGVYLGKLTARKTGVQSYVIFIVRDDRRADLPFPVQRQHLAGLQPLARASSRSTTTARSNGTGAAACRSASTGPTASTARSSTRRSRTGSGEFLLWEFPLAFWLEQHGYDVTYISNLDTHRDPAGLRRAKGFLSGRPRRVLVDRDVRNVQRGDRGGG